MFKLLPNLPRIAGHSLISKKKKRNHTIALRTLSKRTVPRVYFGYAIRGCDSAVHESETGN